MSSDSDNKEDYTADISDAVIQEALESVKRHTSGASLGAEGGNVLSAEAHAALLREIETLKAQLEMSMAKGRELMEKLKADHERALRASADLENFKKRAQKEKEEVQKFGAEKMLKDFLPVLDNLERALEHGRAPADFEAFRQGIGMTRKLFEDTLARHAVKGFSSAGQPFDPRFHEAMQQVETADLPPNHVVSELVKGYMLNDRLIRPALVSVSKAKDAETNEGSDSRGMSHG